MNRKGERTPLQGSMYGFLLSTEGKLADDGLLEMEKEKETRGSC